MIRRIKLALVAALLVFTAVVLAQNSAPVQLALLWMAVELPLFVALLLAWLTGALLGGVLVAMLNAHRSGRRGGA